MEESKNKNKFLSSEVSIGGVSKMDILVFTKNLAITLKSGLTVIEGLEIMRDQAKGKMKKITLQIIEQVKTGESLHSTLEKFPKYFSPLYISMVKTGEVAGILQENMEKLSKQLRKSIKLHKKVKSAMIYPVFVFIAVFALGMSVSLFVLPKILPLFKSLDAELPAATKVLIKIAEVFEAHGTSIAIYSTIGLIFLFWFLKRKFMQPLTHRFILKIPIFGKIIANINLERFNRTLATLIDSGITTNEALRITAHATDNYVYQKALSQMVPQIEAGETLQVAMERYPKLFPSLNTKMVKLGERTGKLVDTMLYLSKYYEEQVDETTKNLSTSLEPILLIFIGIVVAGVAIAIIGPIYEITGSVRN